MEILKVSTKTKPNLVAGVLAQYLNRDKEVEVHTVGAGALNQAIKAIASLKSMISLVDKKIAVFPSFMEVTIEEKIKTAIKLEIKLL